MKVGELLSIYPPFCTKESADGVSIRAIPALERISFLIDFSTQIKGVPDNGKIRIVIK